jgi:3-oxoacyl-[acyl-carrier protein] reductase
MTFPGSCEIPVSLVESSGASLRHSHVPDHPAAEMQGEIQHAVITGGSGALGQAVAAALCAPDWNVRAPGSAELDVREESAVRRYFENRRVDLLVCAAGVTRDAPLLRLSEDAWDQTWTTNFKGAAFCADAVLPDMVRRKSGHIVFISSFSAIHPPTGQAAYAAAKAALLGFVVDLATRHGPSNIRVNAILPGFLETPMTATVTERRHAEILAAHTLGRFNTCERAAAFVRFLHQDLPHTSGQVFRLDSRVALE